MFQRTRLKLTFWYLLFIMSVSLLFSIFIYGSINAEFRRFEAVETIIQDYVAQGLPVPRQLLRSRVEPAIIDAARTRVVTTLGFVNLIIFGVSGAAGYFLAGRTLRPIQDMVDEQNRFIADASHELRTPLTVLRSEIEVGLRNETITHNDAKAILASNLEEVIQLQALSDNLLALAQSGKTTDDMHFHHVSIAQCLDVAIKKCTVLLKQKEIKVVKKIQDVTVYGIADRLSELFVILLDNASKYSPNRTSMSITIQKQKNTAQISFIDQGFGIDAEDIPHIFDRFYRASKSRSKENISGYGLGLAIAKKIVDIHKGTITVSSIKAKGTTFLVKLPIKP